VSRERALRRLNGRKNGAKGLAGPAATGAEIESGMKSVKQWLDLTPTLSSRRGRIIGRLIEKPATAFAGSPAINPRPR
jgi:hypothetical protein